MSKTKFRFLESPASGSPDRCATLDEETKTATSRENSERESVARTLESLVIASDDSVSAVGLRSNSSSTERKRPKPIDAVDVGGYSQWIDLKNHPLMVPSLGHFQSDSESDSSSVDDSSTTTFEVDADTENKTVFASIKVGEKGSLKNLRKATDRRRPRPMGTIPTDRMVPQKSFEANDSQFLTESMSTIKKPVSITETGTSIGGRSVDTVDQRESFSLRMDQLQRVKRLDSGQFGCVYLCKVLRSGELPDEDPSFVLTDSKTGYLRNLQRTSDGGVVDATLLEDTKTPAPSSRSAPEPRSSHWWTPFFSFRKRVSHGSSESVALSSARSSAGSRQSQDSQRSRFASTASGGSVGGGHVSTGSIGDVINERPSLSTESSMEGSAVVRSPSVDVFSKTAPEFVALKMVPFGSAPFRQEIRRECLALEFDASERQKIKKCGSVVQLFNAFLHEHEYIAFVMEFCDCGSLKNVMDKCPRIPQPICQFLALDLFDALHLLHKLHRIHRDIKPSNILLSSGPGAAHFKLADFGCMRAFQAADGELKVRDAMTVCGTVSYRCPQRILSRPYTQQCDVWAAALVLLECVVGEYPFLAQTKESSAMSSGAAFTGGGFVREYYNEGSLFCTIEDCDAEVPKLLETNELADAMPQSFKELITKCLKHDPKERMKATHVLRSEWLQQTRERYSKEERSRRIRQWIDAQSLRIPTS